MAALSGCSDSEEGTIQISTDKDAVKQQLMGGQAPSTGGKNAPKVASPGGKSL